MSLPFFCFAILVNSFAIIWWWPHLDLSCSCRKIISGHISFTKYKKLSWHNFMCFNQRDSTLSLSCSAVNNSVCISIVEYTTPVRVCNLLNKPDGKIHRTAKRGVGVFSIDLYRFLENGTLNCGERRVIALLVSRAIGSIYRNNL